MIVSKILPHILSSNGKCLQDIRICEDANKNEKGSSKLSASEQHLANRLRFSLRVSINVCDSPEVLFLFLFFLKNNFIVCMASNLASLFAPLGLFVSVVFTNPK